MLLQDEPGPKAVRLAVKVVPGSRADAIAGRLGDRLKIKVAAPPEDGKANEAVRRLLADALGIKPNRITILAGHASPEKILRIEGLSAADLADRW